MKQQKVKEFQKELERESVLNWNKKFKDESNIGKNEKEELFVSSEKQQLQIQNTVWAPTDFFVFENISNVLLAFLDRIIQMLKHSQQPWLS
jgi:hypothetical protein